MTVEGRVENFEHLQSYGRAEETCVAPANPSVRPVRGVPPETTREPTPLDYSGPGFRDLIWYLLLILEHRLDQIESDRPLGRG
jgi:hypothetical protein